MARARNIKPALFKNEILGVADPLYTLAFEGLWLLADRDGRMEDRPVRIKAEIFPYRDGLNIENILEWLACNDFIIRYQYGKNRYIQITNFAKHQNPHKNEVKSEIPEYTSTCESTEIIGTSTEEIGTARADSLSLDSLSLDSLKNPPNPPRGEEPAKPSRKFDPIPACPENVTPEVWAEWVRFRKELRKPLTATMCERQSKQLEGHHNPDQVIAESISAGWQGLFPDRVTNVLPIHGGKSGRPALKPGEFYHPDWYDKDPTTHKICHVDTHERATGYSLEYLRQQQARLTRP